LFFIFSNPLFSLNKMKRVNFKIIIICFLYLVILFFLLTSSVFSAENKKDLYSLEDISNIRQFHLSPAVSELLRKNGFAVTPAYYKEICDIYVECKDKNQPIFVTTDICDIYVECKDKNQPIFVTTDL